MKSFRGLKNIFGEKNIPAIIFLAFIAFFWGAQIGIIRFLLQESPKIKKLESYQPSLITRVYGKNGELLAEFFAEKRILVQLSQIPPILREAVIVTEDANFYRHWGFDIRGILRALKINLKAKQTVQGASTITQQLARNLFLTRDRTLRRKIEEVFLSLQVDK